MHGRLKVRSSEEVQEAKRRAKAEKVRSYREITDKIYTKRSTGERDEDALQLTGTALVENPDVASFWNFRREILSEKFSNLSPGESVKLCGRELSLLEHCLRVNPKSYCVWLQRQWVMEHSPQPDWSEEKELCNLFLKYDERNFHCWDYRRYVISKAGVSPQEEFDFTYQKIAANFSNYSAWHYRSKLLPNLHPSPHKEGGVAEEALLKEYELVQNAFFTDPSDQSAWLYHRWLLGKVDRPVSISCLLFVRNPTPCLYFVFNQPVKPESFRRVRITVGDSPMQHSEQSDWPKSLWMCHVPDDALKGEEGAVTVWVQYEGREVRLPIQPGDPKSWWLGEVGVAFHSALTAATSSVLTTELDSCQELLQMEPENKWCLLTTVLLMQALDSQRYYQEVTGLLHKLLEVDVYRQGYYRDLLSRTHIENSLVTQSLVDTDSRWTLDLSKKGLSRLYFTEHMLLFSRVDLSGNHLASLHGVGQLVCVETLILDDNQLESLPAETRELLHLKELSLRNNRIAGVRGLEGVRGSWMESLGLSGNPLCQQLTQEELSVKVTKLLPRLTRLDGTALQQTPGTQ